jgi:hypothetical protein
MQDHGTLHFELINQILFVEGHGPWNKEAFSRFTANLILAKKQDQLPCNWAVLINLTGDPICTPDAESMLIKHLNFEKQCGRIATAFVLTDSTSPQLGKRYITDIYEMVGEKCQFFNNNEQAENWLKNILAQ